MATAKSARVVTVERTGAQTCVVELEPGEPLGFVGGQYIIVDSGLTLPTGKAAKRAYSILTGDADQRRFRLAVKRIPGGLVSGFMHELVVGATLPFSGPWGKLGPEVCEACAAACPACARGTLVIATDTGISAALGLVQAQRMRSRLPATTLLWFQVAGESFLPESLLPSGLRAVQVAALPVVGHPERVPHMRAVLARELARGDVARAYIAGDGAVNYALLDDLIAAGIPATRDSVESFFNMPKKSA
jgi:ferredoxin-NADP reductase